MLTALKKMRSWRRVDKRADANVVECAPKNAYLAKPVDRRTVDIEAVTEDVMRRIPKTRKILAR